MLMSKMQHGLSVTEVRKYKKQLKELLKIPLIKQKTPEWYELRQNMITASDFAQALGEGKFGTQDQLIIKKCQTTVDNGGGDNRANMFFKWGNLFEPVACDLYSLMHDGIKIHEFGLLQHKQHKFFGASPDGISDIGIMLEIKCPFKRKIIAGGDVPKQYYYQIQGQLDVCGLEVCDYFECEFEKSNDATDFDDPESIFTDRYRGVLIDRRDHNTLYGPIIKPNEEACVHLKKWVDESYEGDGEVIYWSLVTWNEQRVKKDTAWVNAKLEDLSKVWDKILYYRQHPEALQIDVAKNISIDTELAFPKKVGCPIAQKPDGKLTGYAFRDLADD